MPPFLFGENMRTFTATFTISLAFLSDAVLAHPGHSSSPHSFYQDPLLLASVTIGVAALLYTLYNMFLTRE